MSRGKRTSHIPIRAVRCYIPWLLQGHSTTLEFTVAGVDRLLWLAYTGECSREDGDDSSEEVDLGDLHCGVMVMLMVTVTVTVCAEGSDINTGYGLVLRNERFALSSEGSKVCS